MLSSALGLFFVLIPFTYVLGGRILYKDHGWKDFQPGVGGARFVALNGLAWTLYAANIIMIASNVVVNDWLLSFASFGVGLISYSLMVSGLLTYQNDPFTNARRQVAVPKDMESKEVASKTFSPELVEKALLHNGQSPTDIWWLFIIINGFGAATAAWIAIAADFHVRSQLLRAVATVVAMWLMAATVAVTHAIGGQWRHLGASYQAFMPGRGGRTFVAFQVAGWASFGTSMLFALLALYSQLFHTQDFAHGKPFLSAFGFLGLLAHSLISLSLFFFKDSGVSSTPMSVARAGLQPSFFLKVLQRTHFFGLNLLLAGGTSYENSRVPSTKGPDDHLQGEIKFAKLTENSPRTGQQYLIIGVGFVGRRLVKRLLERGETKIRLFDILPTNPFAGDARIEYVRGDVTKYDDVSKACEGVEVVYSTFAIIRFMDRLEHQAALSYKINVGGSENVLEACRQHNVRILVVTSSSHATTDEHSLPRLLRDESSPYVMRETAHNHYGWTKAAADVLCLQANGSTKQDGTALRVAIIRPCSGVFGGDDRISFEKAMDLTVFPGLGAKRIMDWVYVENVVLGHLLLESAMQRNEPNVDGEAFNISNNEACKNEDFWFSVMKVMALCDPAKIKSSLEFVYIPESPLWVIGYISELNQRIFKGRVSLGRDLDMLSPGTLATAVMEYSYNSDKAKRVLGYEPAYTVDEAIQRSLYDYWETKFPENVKH